MHTIKLYETEREAYNDIVRKLERKRVQVDCDTDEQSFAMALVREQIRAGSLAPENPIIRMIARARLEVTKKIYESICDIENAQESCGFFIYEESK